MLDFNATHTADCECRGFMASIIMKHPGVTAAQRWIDDFDFNAGTGTPLLPFSHWFQPSLVAAIYLILVLVANATLHSSWRLRLAVWSDSSPLFIAWSALHNIFLVIYSLMIMGGIFVDGGALVRERGFISLLCPSVSEEGSLMRGRALAWAYLFYLVKFYELVDTLLLAIRGKRIIALHCYHHLVMLPTMWSCFNGELLLCLLMASFFNSLVHVIMYSYYCTTALKMHIPLPIKKTITIVQIVQFVMGALGGSTFVVFYVRQPRLTYPYYRQGCAGEPYSIIATTCINLSFLIMFSRFFRTTYSKDDKRKTR